MPVEAARILALLPQTQCARCGYPDCAGYAQAIALDQAGINQCPPGGAEGIRRLAALTGRAATGLNPDNGAESPRALAVIDEDWCIGCTLCVDACPTDAIVGGNKTMHTVIEAYCTGCELCIPVCPVDCIHLENVSGAATGWAAWSQQQADQARSRYGFSSHRRTPGGVKNESIQLNSQAETGATGLIFESERAGSDPASRKTATIDAALKRARTKRELQ